MPNEAPEAADPTIRAPAHATVRWWWLWAVLAVTTGAITVAAADGFNIVGLEFAGTLERANAVIAGANLAAIRSAIYWDFVFIFFYTLALSTGSLWAQRQFDNGLRARIGTPIAIGAIVAGILDVVENLGMLGYLNGWGDWPGWNPLATAMAIPKFLLVVASVTYIFIGVGAVGFRSIADRRHGT